MRMKSFGKYKFDQPCEHSATTIALKHAVSVPLPRHRAIDVTFILLSSVFHTVDPVPQAFANYDAVESEGNWLRISQAIKGL